VREIWSQNANKVPQNGSIARSEEIEPRSGEVSKKMTKNGRVKNRERRK